MSRLIAHKRTPIATIDPTTQERIVSEPVTVDELKLYGRIDIDEQDIILASLVTASRMRIEELTGCVLVPSVVKSRYRQEKGGTRIEMFYCNGIPYRQTAFDYGFPVYLDNAQDVLDIEGLPEGVSVEGIDGEYTISSKGRQDITVTHNAGYTDAPKWAKLAIMQDALWHYQHLGDEVSDRISPEAKATISPYRMSINEMMI